MSDTATRPSLEQLRHFTVADIRAQGYHVAYCPRCGCRKSGHVEVTNAYDEGCSHETCRCHHDHDEQCYGTLSHSDERLCGWDE